MGIRSAEGVQSLEGLAAIESSARLLDLQALAADPPADPDYVERPLFLHPVLNRTIIVKHNVRSVDADPYAPRRIGATKVIFPFDPLDLRLGGQSIVVDQPDFIGALARNLNYSDLPIERDVQVLRMLDRLPTLDPFLVHEILAHQGLEVGRCYFRFSERDQADMLGFVSAEVESLLRLCFQDLKESDTRAKRLSQLLLADQKSRDLDLLRESLRMDAAQFSEAMFTWKGFLYYRWRSQSLMPQVSATLQSLARIRPREFNFDAISSVAGAKHALETTVSGTVRDVARQLGHYDRAFSSLISLGDPDIFRQFLMHGSSRFLELGDRIGRLEQIVSFWSQRFVDDQAGSMTADDLLDGMRDLMQALSISTIRGVRKGRSQSAPAPAR